MSIRRRESLGEEESDSAPKFHASTHRHIQNENLFDTENVS